MSAVRWHHPPGRGRIDAVIVDYATPELAARCLESLRDCELFASIALVDAKRLGWSYARSVNTILRSGHGDIVLALNADTRMLEPPAGILELFDTDPRVAVVGPRQVASTGRITHAGIVGTNAAPRHRYWLELLDDVRHLCDESALDCVSVSGAVYFARRSAWEQLGGFLSTEHYYEETWFSYLARHRGHRVIYTGQTTWEHEWNRSPTRPEWRAQRAVESRTIFRAACQREGIPCD